MKQGVALKGHNTTGPPWRVARPHDQRQN